MSVNIKYNGGTIAEITESVTKTLKTSGKYCEADIVVENTQDGGGAVYVEWHQCPEAVRNYLANVTYNPDDYSTSQIDNYAPATAVVSNYKPIGETIDGKTYYNNVPNVKSPFATENAAGTLKPLDALRWIKTRENSAEAWNVRDLGGWSCDGGTVKYGLLFRGGKLAADDRAVLVGELGVQHDLDLRGREGGGADDESEMTVSPLGNDVWYTRTQQYAWYALTPVASWQTYLRCVIDAVTHREPVYFHCTAGADRTGTLACVLEGLLGMSQSDIDKDYELTCFYSGTGNDNEARRRNETDWTGLINAINALPRDNFRDKCVYFAVETCGISIDDINAYRAAMIDGTPETLYWSQPITNIIDTIGISADARLSTSSGENRAQSGYATIGQNKDAASLIHLTAGDTLRIKGVSLPESNDSFSALAIYNATGDFTVASYIHNGTSWNNLTFSNSGDTVLVTASAEVYSRLSLICTDAQSVIATINEEIT